MEYRAKITISPTPREDKFTVRLFISAVEGETTRGEQLVHESDVYVPSPQEDTEVLDWTAMILVVTRYHLIDAENFAKIQGQVKVMADIFKPQLF